MAEFMITRKELNGRMFFAFLAGAVATGGLIMFVDSRDNSPNAGNQLNPPTTALQGSANTMTIVPGTNVSCSNNRVPITVDNRAIHPDSGEVSMFQAINVSLGDENVSIDLPDEAQVESFVDFIGQISGVTIEDINNVPMSSATVNYQVPEICTGGGVNWRA